ncbi:hypothetical protein IQ06DRAFT_288897 [Phaeosphaeriaceae sp. SRC1lsM3a]|nr:hypothetical protein IQ06DRAFT_288897 [Stagonospora sp. SRC1lsM3a]
MSDFSYAHVVEDDVVYVTSITRNLDIALRHLRNPCESRLMWVDALCIHQLDKVEKSSQVAMMGKIYSFAIRVLIWLGPDADRSDEAFSLLRNLGNEVEMDWETLVMRPSNQCDSVDWADTRLVLPFKAGQLIPVQAFLERPYFRRAWIRQELVLAKEAIVHCGLQNMNWNNFRCAVACLRQKASYEEAIESGTWPRFWESIQVSYYVCRMSQGLFGFSTLRYSQRAADCYDNRDRIYSILSLLNDEDRNLNILPDYTLSVENLFLDIVRRIVVVQKSLAFLDTCHPTSNILKLPTWVPDWSARHGHSQQSITNWSACAWLSAQAHTEGNFLHAAGVAKAHVDLVQSWGTSQQHLSHDDTLQILRKTKLLVVQDSSTGHDLDIVHDYVLAVSNYGFSESTFPLRDRMRVLETIWSSNSTWAQLEEQQPGLSQLFLFLSTCSHTLVNRCCFVTKEAYFGFGPTDMQEGDVVCVFLGCRFPIIIRPAPQTESTSLWQIVGSATVPGLMHGEAIYGARLPKNYQAVGQAEYGGQLENTIDGQAFALHDTVANIIIDDPVTVLKEFGIHTNRYQRSPHKLEISSDILRGAGVMLEDFTII